MLPWQYTGKRLQTQKLLVEENRRRGGRGPEFELIDTGVFDDDRYFDVIVEYAKASEEDICIRIEAFNRGPEDAELHLSPQPWLRCLAVNSLVAARCPSGGLDPVGDTQ